MLRHATEPRFATATAAADDNLAALVPVAQVRALVLCDVMLYHTLRMVSDRCGGCDIPIGERLGRRMSLCSVHAVAPLRCVLLMSYEVLLGVMG